MKVKPLFDIIQRIENCFHQGFAQNNFTSLYTFFQQNIFLNSLEIASEQVDGSAGSDFLSDAIMFMKTLNKYNRKRALAFKTLFFSQLGALFAIDG